MNDRPNFEASAIARGRAAALAAAVILVLSVPNQAAAQGGFNGPGRYEIVNLKSGKALDLDRNNESNVIQFSPGASDTQVWEIRPAGSGFYYLQNVANGKALEAVGTRNSTPVQALRFSGAASQQWRFDAGKSGSTLIVSRLGKTLDIPGRTSSAAAQVRIHDLNGKPNQLFTLRLVSGNDGRTVLKPGWNMFSTEQDIEVGQQVSREAERQLPMLNDSRVDSYLNELGQRLTAHAPGAKFPYAFKAVNDKAINAFALPGGPIYIHRGVIEAADNEAQLAGVMAHEASHVALRHGTNQASKASAAQMPLAILGGMLGNNSTGAILTQLGAGFAVNSILLKYSRTAESQADILGAQILNDAGYDPRAMAQFFETMRAQDEGGQPIAFFSSHPSPERRTDRVNEEIANIGGSARGYRTDSREFNQIKRYVQSLPAPRPNQLQGQQQGTTPGQPGRPSDRFVGVENGLLRMSHPDNWRAYGQGDAITIAPSGGLVNDGSGNQALAYGLIVNIFELPQADRYGRQLQGPGWGQGTVPEDMALLQDNTARLIQEFRLSNRNMRVIRSSEAISAGGLRGLSTYLSNDSPHPNGGRETNWLVTLPRSEGLFFFVFTAPEREFRAYEDTFRQMMYSVRLKE
jgi:hypothetical protein